MLGTAQIVYEIDGTDLNNYERTKDYQKGKVNPFASAGTSEQSGGTTATNPEPSSQTNPTSPSSQNDNTNNVDTNNDNNTNNSNSDGSYLPHTGTK